MSSNDDEKSSSRATVDHSWRDETEDLGLSLSWEWSMLKSNMSSVGDSVEHAKTDDIRLRLSVDLRMESVEFGVDEGDVITVRSRLWGIMS